MAKKLELMFKAPEDVDTCLQVINATSMYIDLYLGRTDNWGLLNLLSKTVDSSLWKVVSKCVVTKSGLSIEDVPIKELGASGVLSALGVFCKGIEDLELPDIMASFCGGITTDAMASMIKDIEKIRQEAEKINDPGGILTNLLGQALARSL